MAAVHRERSACLWLGLPWRGRDEPQQSGAALAWAHADRHVRGARRFDPQPELASWQGIAEEAPLAY
jgi:hypothetical protein